MKIIGIEYRIISPFNRALEIAVFPLELAYPASYTGRVDWNVTTHTTEGDVTLDSRNGNGQHLPHHNGPMFHDPHQWEKAIREAILARR